MPKTYLKSDHFNGGGSDGAILKFYTVEPLSPQRMKVLAHIALALSL
jgi:hypothetical protein